MLSKTGGTFHNILFTKKIELLPLYSSALNTNGKLILSVNKIHFEKRITVKEGKYLIAVYFQQLSNGYDNRQVTQ